MATPRIVLDSSILIDFLRKGNWGNYFLTAYSQAAILILESIGLKPNAKS